MVIKPLLGITEEQRQLSLVLAQHACRDSTAAEKEAYFERSGLRYPGLHPAHSRPSARLTAWAGFCLYGDGWVRAGGG